MPNIYIAGNLVQKLMSKHKDSRHTHAGPIALPGPLTGSPLVIGVENTEDSKPKDGRH